MKESLTSRVGRIVSGGLNALVDAMENATPETVMEEAIREIDGAIDEVRAELGKVVANKHVANTRLLEENRKHEDLAEKIELAVNAGRDDLAEAAVARQLDIEAQIPVLEGAIADLTTQERELEAFVRALQAKKREMREELQQFRDSRREAAASTAASGSAATATGNNAERRAEKAVSAFDRIMEKATGLAASSGAASQEEAAKLGELEELARRNRVQERLAAIKSQMDKDR